MKLRRSDLITKIRGLRNGTLYSVKFVKKDGTVRKLTSIKGTRKGVTGEGMSYNPEERGMITAYDMQLAKKKLPPKDCWRIINAATAIELRCNKEVFEIED